MTPAANTEPTSSGPVIVAEDLHYRYGTVEALRGLSLRVEPREIYGLIGPDGAGKSTTMRLLMGLLAPQQGKVRVLGQNPLSNTAALRNALGYMPQQYSLYGDLSVEENLSFFSYMYCLSRATYRERRERLLHITRLTPFSDRRADALSGGMYKKLALACALLPRPQVLLMDEPTNGVDPVSRRELWALLFELAAEGMAILVSTPYMDEAARCHRVGLMHRGHLLLEGAPAALLDDFSEEVFSVEGGSREQCDDLLSRHEAVIASSPAGAVLRVVARAGSRSALEQLLGTAGATLQDARPEIEDLFLVATTEV